MSTSKLQRYVSQQLSVHFGQYTIRENTYPTWLTAPEGERLELDFLIEELNIAIEVQGKQHYTYVPHFHGGYDGFLKRLEWDEVKRRKCQEMEIALIEIASKGDFAIALPSLLPQVEKREVGLFQRWITQKQKYIERGTRGFVTRAIKTLPGTKHRDTMIRELVDRSEKLSTEFEAGNPRPTNPPPA